MFGENNESLNLNCLTVCATMDILNSPEDSNIAKQEKLDEYKNKEGEKEIERLLALCLEECA